MPLYIVKYWAEIPGFPFLDDDGLPIENRALVTVREPASHHSADDRQRLANELKRCFAVKGVALTNISVLDAQAA